MSVEGGQGAPGESESRPSEALLDAALRLLSARRRGVSELRGRLLKKGFRPAEVADCLEWLEARHYLNDEEFARALVRDRLRFSPRSAYLLRQELLRKGVGDPIANRAVEKVFGEEQITDLDLSRTLAKGWVRKRGPSVQAALLGPPFDPEMERARRRLQGYLARRGFLGTALFGGLDAGIEEAREQRSHASDAGSRGR